VQFRWEKNRNSSLTTPFNSSDDNTYRTIQGAFWVTEGADRCIVGRLAPELKEQQGNLEGRIAQVIEIFSRSASTSKIAYSNKHGGVCLAMLVDKAAPMDSFLNAYLPEVHSESDSDEN
jgi:hypothetical protein